MKITEETINGEIYITTESEDGHIVTALKMTDEQLKLMEQNKLAAQAVAEANDPIKILHDKVDALTVLINQLLKGGKQ